MGSKQRTFTQKLTTSNVFKWKFSTMIKFGLISFLSLALFYSVVRAQTVALYPTSPFLDELPSPSVAQSRSSSLVPPYDINPYFGFRKYGEMRYEPLNYAYVAGSGGRVFDNLINSLGAFGGGAASGLGGGLFTSGGLAKSSGDGEDGAGAAAGSRTGRSRSGLQNYPKSSGMKIPQAALREIYNMNSQL